EQEAQNTWLLRSEGHANANLVSSQRNRVGHYTKYPYHNKDQADSGESRECCELKLRPAVELLQRTFQRAGRGNLHTRVESSNFLAHVFQQRGRIDGGPGHKDSPIESRNAVRDKGLRESLPGRIVVAACLEAAHDPNDFKIGVTRRGRGKIRLVKNVQFDFVAEGILVGKVLARKSFVDHHHVSRRKHIVFGKESPAKQRQSECLKIAIAAHFKARLPELGVRFAGDDCVGGFVLQWRWIGRHFRNRGHARKTPQSVEELTRQCVFPLQRASYIRVIRWR